VLEVFGIAGLGLGANPIEQLIHRCGLGLIFLLVTLSVTPARKLTGQNWLIRFRRMFALCFFILACISGLFRPDQRFDLTAIGEDILKRPYITLESPAWFVDTACTHVNGSDDAPPRAPLAATAPPGVCHCGAGSLAFLLAGKKRYFRATAVCRHSCPVVGVSRGQFMAQEKTPRVPAGARARIPRHSPTLIG
jgi:hypothetical protein